MTTINGEKPQESGPSGTAAKKPLPFKRGVRRGDVLLMVAKLDPDSAKPEQGAQPQDVPACKTPAPATDPGGGRKRETPQAPHGPQASPEDTAPKAEKTGGLGGPGTELLTKGEKDQGTAGKGGGAPQAKGLKGEEPQDKELPGEGGQPGTVEKRGGDPPNKVAKGKLSKDAAGEGKLAGSQIQVKKWGGSLSRKSKWDGTQKKDKGSVLLSKVEMTDEPQTRGGKVDEVQEKVGKMGEVPREMEKARGPQSESGEAGGAGSKTEKGCEAPTEVGERGEALAATEERQPDSRGQEAGLETELGGPRAPALGSHEERPPVREKQEEPALPEGSRGSPSGDLDQVRATAQRGERWGEEGWERARWGQEMDRELVASSEEGTSTLSLTSSGLAAPTAPVLA